MKRASDVPLHKLDEKSTMRNEEDDDPRASEGDESRYGPPVEVGYGIKKADAATLVSAAAHPAPPLQLPATGRGKPQQPRPAHPARIAQSARRKVRGKRTNVVEVTLEGEGKLGLVFVKGSEPPEIKAVKEEGLAAKVRPTTALPAAPCPLRRSMPTTSAQATPKLSAGMTLLRVGEAAVEDLDYGALALLSYAPLHPLQLSRSAPTARRRCHRAHQEGRRARLAGFQARAGGDEGAIRNCGRALSRGRGGGDGGSAVFQLWRALRNDE